MLQIALTLRVWLLFAVDHLEQVFAKSDYGHVFVFIKSSEFGKPTNSPHETVLSLCSK